MRSSCSVYSLPVIGEKRWPELVDSVSNNNDNEDNDNVNDRNIQKKNIKNEKKI